jgi:hypothetical protein
LLICCSGAFAQFISPINPTPTRESKLITGFEVNDVTGIASDPKGAGGNLASLNTDAQFVAEGSKSLKLDLTDIGGGFDNLFSINLPEPIDISGYQTLTMDVYVPLDSLDHGNPEGGWYQFFPHYFTANPDDATMTNESWLGIRNLHAGWNHLNWDLATGTDTKLMQLAFGDSSNGDKPYSGPVYVDNIRVLKGSFTGLKPDERLIFGFDKATDADFFASPESIPFEINIDKQFVQSGDGSLKIDMTGVGGGWTANFVAADDWGTTVDVSKATALHLDLFVPESSVPTAAWQELGFIVKGAGGDVWGDSSGFLTNQWNTLEIPLTADQAAMLTNVKGLGIIRNQGGDWNGPIYIDNLRAVVPTTATTLLGDLNNDKNVNVQDATLSLRIAVGNLTATDAQKAAGDVNGDSKWNVQDTTLILRRAVGAISKFPIEP